MDLQRMDWVLAPENRSIAHARTLIAQKLAGLPDEPLQVVLLLTSELVTNAVRYGTGPVGLHLAWAEGVVRVEVEDGSPEWPVVQAMDRDALGGRGLILVDALSTNWGVVAGGTGKTVWFTASA